MAEKTLAEQAGEIMDQDAQTPECITQLHKIKWRMACEYAEACEILGQSTEAYERKRMSMYVKAKKAGKTDGDSKEAARACATEAYGKKFLYAEYIKGKKTQIDCIKDFCIDYYTNRNEEKSAAMTTQG